MSRGMWLLMAALLALGAYQVHTSVQDAKRCRAKGGEMVKGSQGWVCARVEVIKP